MAKKNDNKSENFEEIKEDLINEEVKNEKKEESEKVEVQALNTNTYSSPTSSEKIIRRKDTLDKNILVPIMNVTNGKLIYQSRKTGSEYQFERYGDVEYMELYELLTMRSSQRKFLDEPFLIVLDDEVSEYLGLSKLYKELTHATQIDGIFKMPLEQFNEIIQSTPKGLAHLIVSKAKEKMKSKELDSVQKVQTIEKVFNVKITS